MAGVSDKKLGSLTAEAANRVKEIESKMEQMKKQQQTIINADMDKQRKQRTHRLIQKGSLDEQFYGNEDSPEKYGRLLKLMFGDVNFLNFLKQCRARIDTEDQKASTTAPETPANTSPARKASPMPDDILDTLGCHNID